MNARTAIRVAAAAFEKLQFTADASTIAALTIEDGKRLEAFDGVVLTETYLYEELAFVIETARQAQMLCGFFDVIAKCKSPDGRPKSSPSSDSVLAEMAAIGPAIAQELVEVAGLEVTRSRDWIAALISERRSVYDYLFDECFRYYGAPTEKAARKMRVAPRNHSILAYHRAVADYFNDALSTSNESMANGRYFPFTIFIGGRYDELHREILTMCDSEIP